MSCRSLRNSMSEADPFFASFNALVLVLHPSSSRRRVAPGIVVADLENIPITSQSPPNRAEIGFGLLRIELEAEKEPIAVQSVHASKWLIYANPPKARKVVIFTLSPNKPVLGMWERWIPRIPFPGHWRNLISQANQCYLTQ